MLQAAETKRNKRQVEKENIIVSLDNSSKLMWELCIDYFVRAGLSSKTFFINGDRPCAHVYLVHTCAVQQNILYCTIVW
jgi:hypothetical protein